MPPERWTYHDIAEFRFDAGVGAEKVRGFISSVLVEFLLVYWMNSPIPYHKVMAM